MSNERRRLLFFSFAVCLCASAALMNRLNLASHPPYLFAFSRSTAINHLIWLASRQTINIFFFPKESQPPAVTVTWGEQLVPLLTWTDTPLSVMLLLERGEKNHSLDKSHAWLQRSGFPFDWRLKLTECVLNQSSVNQFSVCDLGELWELDIWWHFGEMHIPELHLTAD